ncbi:hypothetical protein [Listeria rustica]|uniref:Uncharacterized protein n=1 Tax=Listeria rustica TaxID=2713503 RepID=A0A7W1T613_9LIST|nr:hypothetical protein [Listeria rustica]MBA3926113.1 hypothetical protein [Listeria rustica]
MFKWMMFISSYLPLYFLITIINIPKIIDLKDNFSIITVGFLGTIGVLFIISVGALLYIFVKKPERTVMISSYEKLDDNLISYIMTYLIPLLSIDLDNVWNMIANLFLFLMIGLIYTKYDLIYLNPFLSLAGFYVYRTKSDKYVITRVKLTVLEIMKEKEIEIGSFRLANDVFVYKKIKPK